MVVVGGGVAGLSAAIEASGAGQVIVLEAHPEHPGGSAWWSQGVTAIPTPEQWPGTHPSRVRYRERVQPDVLEWTTQLGLSWLELPGDSVSLMAPVGGGRRLTDTLWRAAVQQGVEVRLDTAVEDISARLQVTASSGERWNADAVILACGGWAGDLPGVRAAMGFDETAPLLNGALPSATGEADRLGRALGGQRHEPAQVVLYGHGTPDPADPQRALVMLGAERAHIIDTTGQPQPWLRDVRGETGSRLQALPGGKAWAVLDGPTVRTLRLQGSGVERHVSVQDVASAVGHMADNLPALAAALSVPEEALQAGVATNGVTMTTPLLPQGPFAALPLVPMTAKSITGLQTDEAGRLLDASGMPIDGLYAAGEAMGFGHPYDDALLDSTMVAGAILTGRVVGQTVRTALTE